MSTDNDQTIGEKAAIDAVNSVSASPVVEKSESADQPPTKSTHPIHPQPTDNQNTSDLESESDEDANDEDEVYVNSEDESTFLRPVKRGQISAAVSDKTDVTIEPSNLSKSPAPPTIKPFSPSPSTSSITLSFPQKVTLASCHFSSDDPSAQIELVGQNVQVIGTPSSISSAELNRVYFSLEKPSRTIGTLTLSASSGRLSGAKGRGDRTVMFGSNTTTSTTPTTKTKESKRSEKTTKRGGKGGPSSDPAVSAPSTTTTVTDTPSPTPVVRAPERPRKKGRELYVPTGAAAATNKEKNDPPAEEIVASSPVDSASPPTLTTSPPRTNVSPARRDPLNPMHVPKGVFFLHDDRGLNSSHPLSTTTTSRGGRGGRGGGRGGRGGRGGFTAVTVIDTTPSRWTHDRFQADEETNDENDKSPSSNQRGGRGRGGKNGSKHDARQQTPTPSPPPIPVVNPANLPAKPVKPPISSSRIVSKTSSSTSTLNAPSNKSSTPLVKPTVTASPQLKSNSHAAPPPPLAQSHLNPTKPPQPHGLRPGAKPFMMEESHPEATENQQPQSPSTTQPPSDIPTQPMDLSSQLARLILHPNDLAALLTPKTFPNNHAPRSAHAFPTQQPQQPQQLQQQQHQQQSRPQSLATFPPVPTPQQQQPQQELLNSMLANQYMHPATAAAAVAIFQQQQQQQQTVYQPQQQQQQQYHTNMHSQPQQYFPHQQQYPIPYHMPYGLPQLQPYHTHATLSYPQQHHHQVNDPATGHLVGPSSDRPLKADAPEFISSATLTQPSSYDPAVHQLTSHSLTAIQKEISEIETNLKFIALGQPPPYPQHITNGELPSQTTSTTTRMPPSSISSDSSHPISNEQLHAQYQSHQQPFRPY